MRAAVGGELKSPKPASEADHVGHLLIVKVEHGLLDISLGANEFFAHSLPVALVAVFEKALAAFGQAIADPERPGLPDESAADVLHVLGPLGNREHEAVRDQGAEMQRSLQPVVVNRIPRIGLR